MDIIWPLLGAFPHRASYQMLSLEEKVDEWYYFLTLECPYGSLGSI
jgi:hypothetical protein